MRSLHTPQQETNSAYNPGVSYQGGQFLAQGIGQASNALAEGLQRYAANKEENAALDTRYESTAKPLMEKLSLYGQLADENSPAASLLDKAADWHKLGTSQKKVLLADMMILGDKTDAEQRRKEEENKWLALQQFHQDQFEQTKKHQADMLGVSRHGMALEGMRTLAGLWNQFKDNARADERLGMDRQNRADVLARFAEEKRLRDAQRGAVGGFLRDFNQLADGPQFNGTGMQRPMGQFEAYRAALARNPDAFSPQMVDNIGTMSVSEDRARAQSALGAFAPTLGTKSVTLKDGSVVERVYGTTSAGGAHWLVPDVDPSKKRPVPTVTITTTDADGNKVTRKLTADEAAALPPTVPADVQKQIADLRKAIAADEGELGASDARLWYGGSRSDRLRQNKSKLDALQRNYGGAKPAAPAAAAPHPDGTILKNGAGNRYKVVNGLPVPI